MMGYSLMRGFNYICARYAVAVLFIQFNANHVLSIFNLILHPLLGFESRFPLMHPVPGWFNSLDQLIDISLIRLAWQAQKMAWRQIFSIALVVVKLWSRGSLVVDAKWSPSGLQVNAPLL